jgi:hypothetical protein
MDLEIKSFIPMLTLSSFLQGLILSNALRVQKNVEDESCTRALGNLRSEVIKLRNEALEKTSFAKVGAYYSEENFIRGNPEGVIDWISGEAKAFEEILSEGFWLSWRRLVAIILKLRPRLKPPSL